MENIRRRLAEDATLYAPGQIHATNSPPISIASSSSSTSSMPVARGGYRRTIVISSDEEDELPKAPVKFVANGGGGMVHQPSFQRSAAQQGVPIRMPVPEPYVHKPPPQEEEDGDDENIAVPEFAPDPYGADTMSSAQAENALRDLMASDSNADETTEIDMERAIVEGFRDGIKLMPHQVLGREWMAEREDVTKKRAGGILADDMGLGKTIQTLTRIMDNRAKKSDKEAGWDAPTLIVCPLALVGQWASEIKKMTNIPESKVIQHQGPKRPKKASELRHAQVVITTYDTVRSEHASYAPTAKDDLKKAAGKAKAQAAAGSDSDSAESEAEHFGRTVAKKAGKAAAKPKDKVCPLFEVKWFRIVLDEAHNIKNRKTKNAQACFDLQGKFRWCLTGTPMQNNVDELYSLFKFLRIKPLNDWERFNTQIAKPVKNGRGAGRAMKRLQVVLKQIMMRRTKTQTLNGKALVDLPPRLINAFYTALEEKMEGVIDMLMKQSSGGSAYIGVLLLLLRLRQACNHPCLVSKDIQADIDAVEPKAKKSSSEAGDVDGDDLAAAFGSLNVNTRKCQMCMLEITPGNMVEGQGYCIDCAPLAIQSKEEGSGRTSSAKLRMILKLLRDIDERSEGEEKTIIFSQFTSMLDLIEPFLREKGIRFVRYDGSMKPVDREAALEKIRTSKTTKVILISFKAGSTGLNLTACNNVILVDLWWNPALEDQAFDRSHRVGQTRPVNIFKLKIDATVEDRILDLQEKKRELAKAALSGDKIKNMKLGMEDLLALFRPGARDEDEDEDD
ncbi:SNF2 family N-terminal domain-containing protein [Roridomyces roridus]|uniref:SNF2 family N-terminal domain-containing protein n=1 Tax=Roridomyces roridus TaxID=1738132 RepID=A0AAD7BXF9_9AGAR|nr:SNF2 family N-terminal domain-containing protein [Roridomyces roridus]